MSTAAVDLQDVSFAWPGCPAILDIPQFSIARGERVFLKGASGSGKSTLLGLLAGVSMPQRGTVTILGSDLGQLKPAKRDSFRASHIGFVFQMFNLLPYLSTLENVLLATRFSRERAGRAPPDAREEALRLLRGLGLKDSIILARSSARLSMGQQQRVAVARALIGRPELVIADEPTSALDAEARAEFLLLLGRECESAKASLLFVSHDMSLASAFDRTVGMTEINRLGRA